MQQQLLAPLIVAETARETGQLAAIEFDDARADAIEEGAVMGDEEQRDSGLDQHVLQPFDGGDVEMVGRLVEEQDFRRDGQRLGQRQAFLLAAGKAADTGLGVETEAIDDLFSLRLVGPRAAGLQFVLQGIHPRQQRIVIARPFGHPVRHLVIRGEQPRGLAHPRNHRLEHRRPRIEGRFLRHIADTNSRLHPDLAVVQLAPPGSGRQRRQQG